MLLANRIVRRALLSSSALAAALPLISPGAVAQSVLVIGAEGTIPPLDPHRLTGTVGLRITDAIFDPLVREELRKETKSAPDLRPGLAASWQGSADGKTYSFRIRQGVTFHDGTPLDAAAVKTNFDRLMDRNQPFFDERAAGAMSNLTRWIASTSAPDAGTFVIVLKEPFAALPRLLTDRRMAILSPAAIKQYKGDELGSKPVGTGAFIFDKFQQGQQLDLKRNDAHWDGKPKVERIIFRQIIDPTTLATAMQAGQIDLIPSAGPQMVEQLKSQKGLVVQYPDPANQYYMRLNMRAELTNNLAFRRALNWAVNRDSIATLLTGQVTPLVGPVPHGNEIWAPGVAEQYGYDLQKAKQLLTESGVSLPVTLKLLVPTNGPGLASAPQVIALVQQNYKAIGVNVEPQFLEFAALLRAEGPGFKPDIHGTLNGWTTGTDAAYWFERMYSAAQHPPRGVNRGWYDNKEVDALFDRARGEVDDAKRNALYRQAATLIASDAPFVFLYQDRLPRVFRDRVTGLMAAASVYYDYPTLGLR